MSGIQVDPEKVIARLTQQIGSMAGELAMLQVALEAAQEDQAEPEKSATEA